MTEDEREQWRVREKEAIVALEESMKFYIHWCESNRIWHRITALIVMVSAVLAPVVIAATPQSGTGPFGLSIAVLKDAALCLTVMLAVTEGVRRIFRFDQRWLLCATNREMLWRKHWAYENGQFSLAVGDPDWIGNLARLQKALFDARNSRVRDFADMLRSAEQEKRPKKHTR